MFGCHISPAFALFFLFTLWLNITFLCTIFRVSRQTDPPLESALAARRSPFYRGGFVLPAQQHCYVSGLQHCDGSKDTSDAAVASHRETTETGAMSSSSSSSVPMPSTAKVAPFQRSETFPCVHATEVLVLLNAAAATQFMSTPLETSNMSIAARTSVASSVHITAAACSNDQAETHENATKTSPTPIAQRIEAVRRAWLSVPHE